MNNSWIEKILLPALIVVFIAIASFGAKLLWDLNVKVAQVEVRQQALSKQIDRLVYER